MLSGIERAGDPRKHAIQPLSFELLAEAGRNPAIAKIFHDNSRGMRNLLAELLRKGQATGEIDLALDPDSTAVVLFSVIDGAKTLTIRDPKADIKKSLALLQLMVTRFLASSSGESIRAE